VKEFLEVFFNLIKDFVSFPICLIFVVCLQIIKNQLYKSGIKFKKQSNWLWITLIMGFPLALLSEGLNNFENWNIARFIIEGIGHAGGSTILFKVIKNINIKWLKKVFTNGEEDGN
jgi:hypothetical protein